MKCRIVQKRLSSYQDKELGLREQEEVRSHLQSCRACREQYENSERVWQTLGALEEIRPDPWFYRQLVRKIKEPREEGLLPAVGRFSQRFRTPAIASMLLAVGILAGTYFGNVLVRSDFLSIQPDRMANSQEAVFDSLKVFDPVPPGTLADGYLRMVNYEEKESR
jgi:predicted anti-sigma-YlaC factor YlaD